MLGRIVFYHTQFKCTHWNQLKYPHIFCSNLIYFVFKFFCFPLKLKVQLKITPPEAQ